MGTLSMCRIGGTDTQQPIACFYFSGLNIITGNRGFFAVLLYYSERLSAAINTVLGDESFTFRLRRVGRNGLSVEEDSVAKNAAVQFIGVHHHPAVTMGAYEFMKDFRHPSRT